MLRRCLGVLEDPRFQVRLRQLGRASDLVWFAALATGISFTLIGAFFFVYPESPSGKFWAYAGLFVRASLYLWSKEALHDRGGETIFRLFALGLVTGTWELLIDWALIHWVTNGRLVYLSGNDVVLLGSPVWMPLAWACVIVELGYPAVRLFGLLQGKSPGQPLSPGRSPLGRGEGKTIASAILVSLAVGIGAGITVGFYEYFAYKAGWWKYEPAHAMIGDFCALYIPLGEFFMFLAILPIAARAIRNDERPLSAAITAGGLFAAAIVAGYALAYLLLELGRAV